MKTLIKIIILFSIIIPKISIAGDVMKKGEVLKEDSYVFTIDEAKDLMNKYESLEKLVEEYKKLDQIQQNKEILLNDIIENKNLQIEEYNKLRQIDLERIKQLNKEEKFSKLEKWGFFTLGIGLTVGGIIVADKLDDNLEQN